MSENAMKVMKEQGRQGDVLIIKRQPKGTEKLTPVEREGGRVILAHGEVTGHAHGIPDRNCYLFLDDSVLTEGDAMSLVMRAGGGMTVAPEVDRVLKVEAPVALIHEDIVHGGPGDHEAFLIPPGEHEVRRQFEYDPAAEAERTAVAD